MSPLARCSRPVFPLAAAAPRGGGTDTGDRTGGRVIGGSSTAGRETGVMTWMERERRGARRKVERRGERNGAGKEMREQERRSEGWEEEGKCGPGQQNVVDVLNLQTRG
eukprot:CAMPEP_0119368258 /NCGR_PEP_ID=MMETSP1334-20130426/14944_1 /TAXON_ID=127549 /ORGANISM="Calcidiscus leptoporus, Strain RCC1130" /LENGTH=108 /DNA_ID=CAMNT_0007384867 /DNA_START=331 /DNA_END=658 /DNA_ORIENTATION=-